MNISLIAAIGKNNELGYQNKLIWHLPNDLKFFRDTTMDKRIVMGYNTFLSIGKALPGRKNIILTSKDIIIPGITIYHSTEELLINELENDEELFIIGGATVYKEFLNKCNKMYLTEIDANAKADVYFPVFNQEEWERKVLDENVEEKIEYKHVLYRRKNE